MKIVCKLFNTSNYYLTPLKLNYKITKRNFLSTFQVLWNVHHL